MSLENLSLILSIEYAYIYICSESHGVLQYSTEYIVRVQVYIRIHIYIHTPNLSEPPCCYCKITVLYSPDDGLLGASSFRTAMLK